MQVRELRLCLRFKLAQMAGALGVANLMMTDLESRSAALDSRQTGRHVAAKSASPQKLPWHAIGFMLLRA